MPRWEYRTFNLWRNDGEDVETYFGEVTAAGRDGWEAVGQVTVSYESNAYPSLITTNIAHLLMKRRLPDGPPTTDS